VVLISDFAMRRRDALALLVPFVVQLALPPTIGGVDVRMAFTIGYLAIGVALLLYPQRRMAIRSWPRDVQDVLLRQPMQAETADVGAAGVSKSM
jgi:hypothetical protein